MSQSVPIGRGHKCTFNIIIQNVLGILFYTLLYSSFISTCSQNRHSKVSFQGSPEAIIVCQISCPSFIQQLLRASPGQELQIISNAIISSFQGTQISLLQALPKCCGTKKVWSRNSLTFKSSSRVGILCELLCQGERSKFGLSLWPCA